MTEAYRQGFMKKCAENGVNPATLVKMAQWWKPGMNIWNTFWSRLASGGTKASRGYRSLQGKLDELAGLAIKRRHNRVLANIRAMQEELSSAAWNNTRLDKGLARRLKSLGLKNVSNLERDFGLSRGAKGFSFGQGTAEDLGKGLATRVGTGVAGAGLLAGLMSGGGNRERPSYYSQLDFPG